MKKIDNQVVVLAIVAVATCALLFIFPYLSWISIIDNNLESVYNIMAFLSMLFSASALLIAAFAFKKSSLKPKIKLNIIPWAAVEEGPALAIDKQTNKVTNTRPLESWHLSLINDGKVSAKNPIVIIRFKDAYFGENSFPGWIPIDHANALGWFGFQWTPKPEEGQVVHPGFPYYLPKMHFANSIVSENLKIQVLIAADGIGTIKSEIPVRLV